MSGTTLASRPTILILWGPYWPGHESAGPILSIRSICESLADDFDFRLIARDRPYGAPDGTCDVTDWHDHGFAQVHYLRPGRFGAQGLVPLMQKTDYGLLYINSYFDKDTTIPAIVARRRGTLPSRPTVLAPRGEFSDGALSLKPFRKKSYLGATRMLDLMRDVVFQATSPAEKVDIQRLFPSNRIVEIANTRPLVALPRHEQRQPGQPLRMAFCGRISPVKGLLVALESLAEVKVPVTYNIYGPISDPAYWAECERAILQLPEHVHAQYVGELPNAAVMPTLADHDLYFMPSRSENFGHAIFESLCAGTPVLIGDKTPWQDLEAGRAGYDVENPTPSILAEHVNRFAALPEEDRVAWRHGARRAAERATLGSNASGEMRALLNALLDR